jgi:hypothetical protein
MPPEVQRGACATAASDIYCFGVCVLHALVPAVVIEHDPSTFVRRVPACCKRDAELWDLLSQCLAPLERKRPTADVLLQHPFFRVDCLLQEAEARRAKEKAQAAAEEAARQAALRMCLVCMEEVNEAEGLGCGGPPEAHFVCDDCLEGHVTACAENEQRRLMEQRRGVWCVAHGGGCKRVYADHAVARHVSPTAFAAYFAAKSKIEEARISSDLEKGFDLRVQQEADRIAAMSEAEKRMRHARHHIIERILQLACPRCGQAFPAALDGELPFNGCFALTCSRTGCGCGFCAYCLKDCGADAHAHVNAHPKCSAYNTGLFPADNVRAFNAASKERQERALRTFLNNMPDATERAALVVDVARELTDLGLDPNNFL